MSSEQYICYWSGAEPPTNLASENPNDNYYVCPTLDQMPAYVDVVNLFHGQAMFGNATKTETPGEATLSFEVLTTFNSQEVIMGWMSDLRSQNPNVKILLTVGGDLSYITNQGDFATEVANAVASWGADGVDIDYEPPAPRKIQNPNGSGEIYSIVLLLNEIRSKLEALKPQKPMTMSGPIYEMWLDFPGYLQKYAECLDYLTTMDYSPYPGPGQDGAIFPTTNLYTSYVEQIGTPGKLAIGVSCQGPRGVSKQKPSEYFTPLEDVRSLCKWEPPTGEKKLGIMLYGASYDVTVRYWGKNWEYTSGTGQSNGTFLETVHEFLP